MRSDVQVLRDELRALFRDVNEPPWTAGGTTEPPAVDVIDMPDAVEIRLDLIGVGPEDLTVEVERDMLRVRGGRRVEELETAGAGRNANRRRRTFLRGIQVPRSLEPGSLEARFAHGLLTLRLAKRPRS